MKKNNSTTTGNRFFAAPACPVDRLGMTKRKALGTTKGFTMVEIIVVLFIISVGIVGVLSLIVQNISSQSYDKNNLVASQLAQEGIELIRKVRDSNWAADPVSSFDQNLVFDPSNPTEDGSEYYMDYLDSAPNLYVLSPAGAVLRQDSNGFYVNGDRAGTSTIFSRRITIAKLSPVSLQVDSSITWTDHNHNYSYNLETLLYDWK
ncbi:MAG: type II secretion system protein [Patescibacteria group bacterium]|jgi:prepilin-type N-terminal cleavage/methylation domain-containing protein